MRTYVRRPALGYVETAGDNPDVAAANMAMYGTYTHTAEELASINSVITAAAAGWQTGMTDSLSRNNAANAQAVARAAEVNAILCRAAGAVAGNCSKCFADTYRAGMTAYGDTTINDSYNHNGVSCSSNAGRIWFNRAMSAQEIADIFLSAGGMSPNTTPSLNSATNTVSAGGVVAQTGGTSPAAGSGATSGLGLPSTIAGLPTTPVLIAAAVAAYFLLGKKG